MVFTVLFHSILFFRCFPKDKPDLVDKVNDMSIQGHLPVGQSHLRELSQIIREITGF